MKPTQWLDDTDVALEDAAQRYLQAQYRFDARMQLPPAQRRFDPRVWNELGQMGWCSVAVDESQGGLGLRPSSIVLLAQSAGQALMNEPFIHCGVVPGILLGACAAGIERDALLADALQGQRCIVATPALAAVQAPEGRLTAHWPWVPDADIAHTLLVPVEGVGVYVVPADHPGLTRTTLPLLDGRGAASVVLRDAQAVLLPQIQPDDLTHALALSEQLACLAIAADSVGVMRGAVALTLEYLKTRKQFGAFLGQHQVLQHRAVDMHIQLKECESVVRQAMRSMVTQSPDRALQVHAAKAVACDSARTVTQEAVQLHGGIGITEEYAVSHYLRRARVNEQLQGSTEHHFQAFVAAMSATTSSTT